MRSLPSWSSRLRELGLLVALTLVAAPAAAQQILIDQGLLVDGLWCFPQVEAPDQWYYLPQTAALARHDNGMPVFSFLRYAVNRPSESGDGRGVVEADGGGIVTLMATYDTPASAVRRAQRAIRKQTKKQDAVLRGPIIFKEGRYVLVSSILREDGEEERRALASGNAPVFEGNEVAFSFDVDPQQSKLLLESFKMATPDVSIVFEMTMEGLTDAYDATITVDWNQVQKHEKFTGSFNVGGPLRMYSADVEESLDELRETEAIQLEVRGERPNMDKLVDKAYQKLTDLLFTPVQPLQQDDQPSQQGGGGFLDGIVGGLTSMLGAGSGPLAVSRSLAFLSVQATYQSKEVKKSGKSRIHMNAQTPVERYATMAANIGDLYRQYGEDENVFRTVNLSDPAYQQREIHVGIDGAILPEFEKYINGVTVTLRKQHQNGEQTLGEIVVDRKTFNEESRDFRILYGWNGDEDRDAWLDYDFRTRWSFKGGGLYETDWVRTQTNMIDLYAPYRRNTVELIGDEEALREAGVRAVDVVVEYDFFDGKRSQEVTLTTKESIDGQELEITLPHNVFEYDYTVTWIRRGADPVVQTGRDDTGVIFVDLPEEAAEGEAAAG